MEFERTAYSVRENAGQVEVCVAITSRHSHCPVAYDFSLLLMSEGGSAGKISPHFSKLHIMFVLGGNGEDQLLSGSCSSVPIVYWTSSHLSLTPNKSLFFLLPS